MTRLHALRWIAVALSAALGVAACEQIGGPDPAAPELYLVHLAGTARLGDGTPVPGCTVEATVRWWAQTGSGWFEGEFREVHHPATTDRSGRYQISYEAVCGTSSSTSLVLTPPSGLEIAQRPARSVSSCTSDVQTFDFVLQPAPVMP